MKRLRRSYTVLEMDKGEGMKFHPVSSHLIASCLFHEATRQYCFQRSCYVGGGFQDLPRIGDGKEYAQGDPYPSHWLFDPDTGEKQLKCEKKEPQRSVLTAWEME